MYLWSSKSPRGERNRGESGKGRIETVKIGKSAKKNKQGRWIGKKHRALEKTEVSGNEAERQKERAKDCWQERTTGIYRDFWWEISGFSFGVEGVCKHFHISICITPRTYILYVFVLLEYRPDKRNNQIIHTNALYHFHPALFLPFKGFFVLFYWTIYLTSILDHCHSPAGY